MSMSMKFKLGDKVEVIKSDLSKCSGQTGTVVGLVAPAYFEGDEVVIVRWDGPAPKGYERTLYRTSNLTLATDATGSYSAQQQSPK